MSLLDLAGSNRRSGLNAQARLSGLHEQRSAQNQQLEAQEDARRSNAAGGALSMGISAGVATGNPLVGLGVAGGALLLSLF